MNQPSQPSSSISSRADEALRKALRELPAQAPAAEVEALVATTLAQWHQRHPGSAAPAPAPASVPTNAAWRRRGLWLGTASVAVLAVVAAAVLLNRPDPDLDDLMELDVLSQVAIGEL